MFINLGADPSLTNTIMAIEPDSLLVLIGRSRLRPASSFRPTVGDAAFPQSPITMPAAVNRPEETQSPAALLVRLFGYSGLLNAWPLRDKIKAAISGLGPWRSVTASWASYYIPSASVQELFFHLVRTAFKAISFRRSGVSAADRARPALDAALRRSSLVAGNFLPQVGQFALMPYFLRYQVECVN